MRKENVEAP